MSGFDNPEITDTTVQTPNWIVAPTVGNTSSLPFSEMNRAYDETKAAWDVGLDNERDKRKAEIYAQDAAEEVGGPELQKFVQEQGTNDIKPMLEKDYNPVTIQQAAEQVGLTQPNADSIISQRYTPEGKYMAEKLSYKVDLMKDLYGQYLFETNNESVDVRIKELLEKGLFSPTELNEFSKIREQVQKAEGKIKFEAAFLATGNNDSRKSYLNYLVAKNELSPEEATGMANKYGLAGFELK